jgi:5-methylcytosine-specific restriction protein A
MTRVRISNTRRAKLFADKGGLCHLCQTKVQAGEAWDVSHVIPLAVGGSDDESNWDVAHRKCHRTHTAKHDQPLIAKVERQRLKHIGAWRSKHPMRSWRPLDRRTGEERT